MKTRREFLITGSWLTFSYLFLFKPVGQKLESSRVVLTHSIFYPKDMDSNYAFEISKQWIDRNKIKLVDDEFRAAGLLLVVDDYLNEDCYYVRRTFKDSAACDMWENKIALSKAFEPNSLMSSPFRIAKNRQS